MSRFDFIGRRKIWFTFSAFLMILAIGTLAFKGLNFSLEFTGGTSISWQFEEETGVEEIRDELARFDLGGSSSIIQPVGPPEDHEFLIRTRTLSVDNEDNEQNRVIKGIETALGGERLGVQTVGPAWGAQVTRAAAVALVLSIAAILLFISFRFEYKMALSAVTALLHDVIIAVGIYALVGREVSPATIAAFLTIMGYSLYDTIVVFHRIKENVRKVGKQTYAQLANLSVNQVIVRSINTSITTLLPVMALLFFGGETLKDFAFALMVGLAPATYSSIFIASPILAWWKEREPRYANLKRRAIVLEEQGEDESGYRYKRAKAGTSEGKEGSGDSDAESLPGPPPKRTVKLGDRAQPKRHKRPKRKK